MTDDIRLTTTRTDGQMGRQMIRGSVISEYLDDRVREFVNRLQMDRTYIKNRQDFVWNEELILAIVEVLKRIVFQYFKAEGGFEDFFNFGNGGNHQDINGLIEEIKNRFMDNFKESPPFTIYRFIETMVYSSNEFDGVLVDDVKINNYGLKNYTVRVNDLISEEQTEVNVINKYHEEGDEEERGNCLANNKVRNSRKFELTQNNILAVKYLRSLIKIISVQSNIDEVTKNLQKYGSKNCFPMENIIEENNEDNGNENDDTASEDTSSSSIKMVKIPWSDESLSMTTVNGSGVMEQEYINTKVTGVHSQNDQQSYK